MTKRILKVTTATDMIALLQSRLNNPTTRNKDGERIGSVSLDLGSSDPGYYGTETAQEYLDLYKYGWKVGRDSLKNSIANMLPKTKIELATDVIGFNVSVADYVTGNPENMLTIQYKTHRCIDIVVPTGWTSKVESEQILCYAGAVTVVLKSLIDSGYRVNLKTFSVLKYDELEVGYLTTIVKEGDILDIDKIASCFHSSFFRRAQLAVMEMSEHRPVYESTRGCYGRPQNPNKAYLLALDPQLDHDLLFFPKLSVHGDANQTAVLNQAIADVKQLLNGEQTNEK